MVHAAWWAVCIPSLIALTPFSSFNHGWEKVLSQNRETGASERSVPNATAVRGGPGTTHAPPLMRSGGCGSRRGSTANNAL